MIGLIHALILTSFFITLSVLAIVSRLCWIQAKKDGRAHGAFVIVFWGSCFMVAQILRYVLQLG